MSLYGERKAERAAASRLHGTEIIRKARKLFRSAQAPDIRSETQFRGCIDVAPLL
jgi:hypothetical protein